MLILESHSTLARGSHWEVFHKGNHFTFHSPAFSPYLITWDTTYLITWDTTNLEDIVWDAPGLGGMLKKGFQGPRGPLKSKGYNKEYISRNVPEQPTRLLASSPEGLEESSPCLRSVKQQKLTFQSHSCPLWVKWELCTTRSLRDPG